MELFQQRTHPFYGGNIPRKCGCIDYMFPYAFVDKNSNVIKLIDQNRPEGISDIDFIFNQLPRQHMYNLKDIDISYRVSHVKECAESIIFGDHKQSEKKNKKGLKAKNKYK
jgi:hypothetical protein